MKIQKFSSKTKLYLCAGLLLQSASFLLHELFWIPDFFRGFMQGISITLILMALIIQRKINTLHRIRKHKLMKFRVEAGE